MIVDRNHDVSDVYSDLQTRAGGSSMTDQSAEFATGNITIDRSELIPGSNGARLGYSDAFPDRKFLIIPIREDDPA